MPPSHTQISPWQSRSKQVPHKRSLGTISNTVTRGENEAKTHVPSGDLSVEDRPRHKGRNYRLLRRAQKLGFSHASRPKTSHLAHAMRPQGAEMVPDAVNYCQRRLPKGWNFGGERVQGDCVAVYRKRDTPENVRLGGVFHCGNVWGCAVCAPRIAGKRARDVAEAMDKHYAAGGGCLMLTWTFRHHRGEALDALLDQFQGARRRFKMGASWVSMKGALDWLGSITALEITWGKQNGWHPHTHEIAFTALLADDEIAALERRAAARWTKILEEWGLEGLDEIALKITRAHSAEYLTKFGEAAWGAESELTRATEKEAHGLTPWQILARADDPMYEALYREYYAAMRGRRQLVWTAGLRARFGIGEEVIDGNQFDLDYECVGLFLPEQYDHLANHHLLPIFFELLSQMTFSEAVDCLFSTI